MRKGIPGAVVTGSILAGTIILIASQSGGVGAGTNPHPDNSEPGHTPVAICHSGNGKHYELIVVDDDSTLLQGHQNHEHDIFVVNPAPNFECPSDSEETTTTAAQTTTTAVVTEETSTTVGETSTTTATTTPVGSDTTTPAKVQAETITPTTTNPPLPATE